jgi:DNA-binding SARP family transcriptional activator
VSTGPLIREPDRAGLLRPRLLEALGSLRTSRLAIVAAPAGTGKTTLLTQFAQTWPGPVGWWQVEPGNASVGAVVRGVRRAVGDPAADEPADLDELIERLSAAPQTGRLLVVDDLHLLDRTEAEAALETLILRTPASLRLLVGSRRMPGVNLAQHELSATTVITAEDLRFRSWEVEYLLADVYREPLPPDDVAALTRRLNGWAAGVHMFHLSTTTRPLAERRRAIAALDGRSALTRGYLARTVLAELPADLRDFVVRTCVFEVLTPARCDGLLERPGHSARLLAELDRRQAFTSTSDGGVTYRYHDVLRAHLAGTLAEELGEDGARRWHARAAEQLVAEGALVDAARAYARAEEWSRVVDLLDELAGRVADEDIEPWRELLPGWLVAGDPWLIYAEARHLLARGQVAPAVERLRQAEEHLTDEPSRAPVRALRHLAAVWLPGGDTSGGHGLSRLRAAVRGHPALIAGTTPDQPLVTALAYLLAGNLAEARRALAAPVEERLDLPALAARLLQALLATAERRPEARRLVSSVLADAERGRLPWLVRLARAGAALGGGEAGLADARAVVRECDRDGDPWGALLALGMICLVRSLAAEVDATDLEEAAELLERCRRAEAATPAAWAQALLALATARASLGDAELEAQRADALARSTGVPGARVMALAAAARCGATRADVPALAAESGMPVALAMRWAGDGHRATAAGEPPPIEVWCLGGFRIRRHGVELDCSTIKPRTRALLRVLATYAGRPVHREHLIEALWPDMPLAAATRSLQVGLSSLRTFLEPGQGRGKSEIIVRHGEAYELALPGGGASDVARFRAALGEAQHCELAEDTPGRLRALRAALVAYGGELLPEDGPAEWVVPERAILQRHAAEAAVELARMYLKAGQVSEAMLTARRCVEIDRYCDPGWQLLIEACDLMPSPAAAARARRGYAEMLSSLGIAEPVDTLVPNRG